MRLRPVSARVLLSACVLRRFFVEVSWRTGLLVLVFFDAVEVATFLSGSEGSVLPPVRGSSEPSMTLDNCSKANHHYYTRKVGRKAYLWHEKEKHCS